MNPDSHVRSNRRTICPERSHSKAAFTLLELMLAIAIFAGVLAAIYSTWTAILRSSRIAQNAAADIQRSRIAVQAIEQALVGAQMTMFANNAHHFSFLADLTGPSSTLSFVARLPETFPRAGRFGDLVVRRVTFNLQTDISGRGILFLRQTPLLFEPDVDEEENPLVLAHDIQFFEMAFWDPQVNEWELEWPHTNQLPRMVRFSLGLGAPNRTHLDPAGIVTRVVVVPAGNRQAGHPVGGVQAPAPGPTPPPASDTPSGNGPGQPGEGGGAPP